jgi:hypothetical protein
MSLNDPKAVYAGFAAISQGVDSGRSPMVLAPEQLSWMVNGTARGGFLTTRPGVKKLDLVFTDQTGSADATTQARFEDNRFQGASPYVADNGRAFTVASIGGRIFITDLSNYNTQDLTSQAGFVNEAGNPQAWFCQAEKYLIIQNNSESPMIYDGATLRRSKTAALGGEEVPIGNAMEYNNGRLWVALTDGLSFVAGDLVYSHSDAPDNGRGSLLRFTENTFLNGGGAFIVPANAGKIRALRSIAIQDSSTGQGPLQIFTTRGAFSVNAPFDRAQWQNTTSPIQTVSLLAAGACAQNSTVLVNGDVWFRSPDGVRSFQIARRDHGTWVNTPLSNEVKRALSYDTPELLQYASGALFDNRLLETCAPESVTDSEGLTHGIIHKGLVAVDFEPVSQMFNRTSPVWEGLWTGLNILQILTVDNGDRVRCLIYALNSDNEIELWELTKDARFDSTDNRIVSFAETGASGFADGGWNEKQLAYGDIWLNRVAGTVDVTVQYRRDSDPIWQTWNSFQVCAKYKDCDTEQCGTPTRYLEQFRTRKRLPAPSSTDCDTVTGKPYNLGYRFAARITWTGFCAIPQFRMVARNLPEHPEGGCEETSCELVGLSDTCQVDDFAYQTEE